MKLAESMQFGEELEDLKYAWRLCRKARKRGVFRPFCAWPIEVNTDTGYIYRHNGLCFIVADGSDNFREWLVNFFWIRWGRDKVAAGFLRAAYGFAEAADKLLYIDDLIVLIGHSRGGFIQKTAIELSRLGYCIESVITFGSPKMGGRKFCDSMADQDIFHVRVFSHDDPVPDLPRLRGKHYESLAVTFPRRRDVLGFTRMSRFVRGVVDHLSYGSLLKGKTEWNYSRK